MSEEMEVAMENTQEFRLDLENELRFEVGRRSSSLTLELKSGLAEIFGTELVKNKRYVFATGTKVAVFTWHGCVIELTGKPESVYVAKETPMIVYVNIHAALEHMMQTAEQKETKGPTVMIVGPTDVGKSTLTRILLNYAVRQGRRPVYVDLDVGQGQISVPGTVGALLVEKTSDVEEGFSQQAPLVYHFGHKGPGNNIVLYNMLVTRLAQVVRSRFEGNNKASVSGVFINTCGWVKSDGYRSITHAASAFEVDVVVVIDHERLYSELNRDMPRFVKVILVPKSGGAVERSQANRIYSRDNRVREYFYGVRTPLYPHSFQVKFSDIKVYKIGVPSLPDSCLPAGKTGDESKTKVVPVAIGPNLLHRVLSVSFVSSIEEDIVQTNVAGFICVTAVDCVKHLLTVLAPQPRLLPNTILLSGDIQFMDAY